ncbi:hypothetical protein [Parabacteroides sp. PF5-6]|uniref:hypothetical protein n=1 Tax=Parabacteroides sp. PF5-6 TaxID=1742403 RepID=UPI002405C046|nr:hypothetical protein [Parabacteroides sp. PF5-6]MDF9831789.1 hypothetical protein [Parabacteroides sp. PF5-6]
MIDHIRLRTYDPLVKKKIESNLDKFECIRPCDYKIENEDTGVYLRLTINESIVLKGSLRKWYFGECSLKDFTSKTFLLALRKLSKTLGIPTFWLFTFDVWHAEIGLNVKMKVDFLSIKPFLVGFRDQRYETFIAPTSVKFKSKTKNYKAIMYDKCKEIIDTRCGKKRLSPEESDFLKKSESENWTRVEFTLSGGKKELSRRLSVGDEYGLTLGELQKNFSLLYSFFWRETGRFEISPKSDHLPVFDGKSAKEYTDYLLIYAMKDKGLHLVFEEIKKTGDRGLKSRLLKKFYKLMADTSCETRIMRSIYIQLLCQLGREGKIRENKTLLPAGILKK